MTKGQTLSIFISGLLLISITSYSQVGIRLNGRVSDPSDGLGIGDVEVTLQPSNKITLTDRNGDFHFNGLAAGKYTLIFNHLAYEEISREIELFPGQDLNLHQELSPRTRQLDEVEVSSRFGRKAPYRIEYIRRSQILRGTAGDLGDLLRSEPNLGGIRKGGGNIDPVIRGFKFSQLNVVVDGGTKIEGGCPNRMDPAVSHVDIGDISEVEIIKGPFALRYGPNFGGVINLQTLQPEPSAKFRTHVNAIKGWESNWNGNKEFLSLSGGNRNVYFLLSGNHKKYGNYESGSGEIVPSAFTRYNYSAHLGISPAKNQHLLLSFDRSYGRNVKFPTLPMDERSDDTHILSLDYKAKFNSKVFESLTVKAHHSDVHHIMDNKDRAFSDTVVAVSDIRAKNSGGRAEATLKLGTHSLVLGIDYEQINKTGQRSKSMIAQPNLPVKIEDLWKDAWISNTGFYILWNKTFGEFDLSLSGRLDKNQAKSEPMVFRNMMGEAVYSNEQVKSDYTNLSAGAGIIWNINGSFSAGLSLGRGLRSPDMTERFIILLPVGFDNYDYLGNPALKPEANNEADLSFTYNKTEFGKAEISGFFSYVTDYISAKEMPPSLVKSQTKGVLGVKQFYNADNVYLYGFEFTYNSPLMKGFGFSAVAAVTYGVNPSATKYIISEGEVIGEEIVKNDPLPEIPPLESTLTAYYQFFRGRLIPRLKVRFVSPQNHISEVYHETSSPGFVLGDFIITYNYNKYLSLSGGVNNIFNKNYYEHLNRRIIGSSLPLYEPGRIFYINLNFNI